MYIWVARRCSKRPSVPNGNYEAILLNYFTLKIVINRRVDCNNQIECSSKIENQNIIFNVLKLTSCIWIKFKCLVLLLLCIFQQKDDSACLLATNPSKGSHRNDAQNKKEKRQLIIATTLCFFFMVSGQQVFTTFQASITIANFCRCCSFVVYQTEMGFFGFVASGNQTLDKIRLSKMFWLKTSHAGSFNSSFDTYSMAKFLFTLILFHWTIYFWFFFFTNSSQKFWAVIWQEV